jgi:hypothetical protein
VKLRPVESFLKRTYRGSHQNVRVGFPRLVDKDKLSIWVRSYKLNFIELGNCCCWFDKKTIRRRYTRLASVELIFNEKINKQLLDVLYCRLVPCVLFSFSCFSSYYPTATRNQWSLPTSHELTLCSCSFVFFILFFLLDTLDGPGASKYPQPSPLTQRPGTMPRKFDWKTHH